MKDEVECTAYVVSGFERFGNGLPVIVLVEVTRAGVYVDVDRQLELLVPDGAPVIDGIGAFHDGKLAFWFPSGPAVPGDTVHLRRAA